MSRTRIVGKLAGESVFHFNEKLNLACIYYEDFYHGLSSDAQPSRLKGACSQNKSIAFNQKPEGEGELVL